ncbi:hypothetical protein MRB53_010518 [Persea americana]|uniref:Uncharacterized protein n=1 Tax=Persea americana TaxID=3435 RepID=A0ACC2LS00_PERAE|nr:hypothetical protein MRB53_010518 [Persea americana]
MGVTWDDIIVISILFFLLQNTIQKDFCNSFNVYLCILRERDIIDWIVRCKSCNYQITSDDLEDWLYMQLADTTHLLHGVVHVNGYGHLLKINGREGGSKFLSGCHIMDFWDRLCKMLRVSIARQHGLIIGMYKHGRDVTAQEESKPLPLLLPFPSLNKLVYLLPLLQLKLGYEHPLMVCCGTGGKYNFNRNARCGEFIVVNGTETIAGACKDPSARINWDGVHYTEATNEWVFKQIADGAFSDPPIPLRMACHKEINPSTS